MILFSGKGALPARSRATGSTYEKEKSIDRVHKALTALKPAEDTNLYTGLEEAFKYRDKGLDTIYFFSDGLPTSGPGLTAAQERSVTSETERSAILARHIRRTLTSTWNRAEAGQAEGANQLDRFLLRVPGRRGVPVGPVARERRELCGDE